MTSTTTTHVEHLSMDGPINFTVAVVIGCLLLWLFAWSLRREKNVIGTRNTVFFWLLRVGALGIVLWMLLAPTTVRLERSTTRKTIAIVVDVSGSMRTVDPAGTFDDLRWATAAKASSENVATQTVDRALAAVKLAERRLLAATTAIQQQQPERVALESAAAADDAVKRTRANLALLSEYLKKGESNADSPRGDLQQQAIQALKLLEGSDFERLSAVAASHRDRKHALKAGWREGLADLKYQIVGIRRRLAELANQVAKRDQDTFESANPNIVGRHQQQSRLEHVGRFVQTMHQNVLVPLRNTVNIQHSAFDDTFANLSDQDAPETAIRKFLSNDKTNSNDKRVTNISSVLEKLKQQQQHQQLAAVFLVTDMAHNDPDSRDPREAAAELFGTPVYVIPIGNPNHIRDVQLKSVFAPNVVMRDDDIVVIASLQAYDCEGETCRVELMKDGEVLQHRDVELDSAAVTRRVRFDTRMSDVGTQRFQVRVVPLKEELSQDNNYQQFEVNVTRNHIDVLLADEMPRWEYRYLAQLFRRDRKVECDELLFRPRMIATGKRKKTKSFPMTADEWGKYDVVLLGDVAPEHLSTQAQESLIEFLRNRGGTLVMIAGDENMPQAFVNQPLHEILPVVKVKEVNAIEARDGYAFHVTQDGWEHHALMIGDTETSTRLAWDFINRNAPLHALSEYRQARSSARTLIAAVPRASLDENPDPAQSVLLCWQPVGRGRIVYLASPETYRLRYLRGDRLHYRFWGQLLRWAIATDLATGSELLSVRTDKSNYQHNESVQVVVRLKDEQGNAVPDATVNAVAIRSDDSRETIPLRADDQTPGRYVGQFERLSAGIYRVEPRGTQVEQLMQAQDSDTAKINPATASFTVQAKLNRELLDTRCDRALAQQIADATGGLVLPPTAVEEILMLTDLEPEITEKIESIPLWVQWKYLWIVFGCISTEWIIRKRMGLS